MTLIDRDQAARLGRETVSILRAGAYTTASGRTIELRDALEAASAATIEYPPERDVPVPASRNADTHITVENATVLSVGERLARAGPVAALNFASATSPGGGFLTGARAQEESIARASGLFHLLEGRSMYDYHRSRWQPLYSDYVIYSPDVPVLRTDSGELLEQPWMMTILTSPAVNGNELIRHAFDRIPEVPAVMTRRTAKVLAVAAHHGVRRLILGAWGCGAFGLDPSMMAGIFRDALSGPFRGCFDEIVFAITDWSPEQRFIRPFQRACGG